MPLAPWMRPWFIGERDRATHLCMDGGALMVPALERDLFLNELAANLRRGEVNFLC